jgi:hypothetical protein
MVAAAAEPSKDVEPVSRRMDASILRNAESLSDLVQHFPDGIVNGSEVLGDGFTMLSKDEKSRLCGVPLLFVEWTFSKGDFGDQSEFVVTRCVQADGTGKIVGKFIFIDGSTGVYQQLKDYSTEYGSYGGVFFPKGLRKSEYEKEVDGKMINATTFYIDTSAA